MSDLFAVVRWAVALTVYPFFLIEDIVEDVLDRRDERRWLREHEQRFRDMAEGQ